MGTTGSGDGQFYGSSGVAVDDSGRIYVTDLGNNRVQKFTSKGVFLTKWGIHGVKDIGLSRPYGIAIGPDRLVYVVDAGNQCIKVYRSLIDQAVTPGEKQLITWGKIRQSVLYQNYPNPFNPETWMPYQLSRDSRVSITIHNATGVVVRRLDLGWKQSGIYQTQAHAAYWDGIDNSGQPVASGVYFYQFKADEFLAVRKMILIR